MNIALLGYGVVGKGVYDIISNDHPNLKIKYIVEKDKEKLGNLKHLAPTSFTDVLEDNEIDVVIELIGGKTVAYQMIKEALLHKKHVVTANKAVISEFFEELTTIAKSNDVSLLFEASVGGAIIVLDPLYRIAEINKISGITGIINGSTNFVLSSIFLENQSLEDALKKASDLGYIEANSTDDMDGFDLLRKINILSMISYHTYIKEEDIERTPLSSISSDFISYVKSHNLAMKYIATSKEHSGKISIHLEPVILEKEAFYNQINFEDNIISITGAYHKNQLFIGQGAGRYPTASAVLNDILVIEKQEKREHKFNCLLEVSNAETYRFLIQTINGFKVVENKTINEVKSIKDLVCFARLEGDIL